MLNKEVRLVNPDTHGLVGPVDVQICFSKVIYTTLYSQYLLT
jgi:hypothetical protein